MTKERLWYAYESEFKSNLIESRTVKRKKVDVINVFDKPYEVWSRRKATLEGRRSSSKKRAYL
jgi:hypothetical protein